MKKAIKLMVLVMMITCGMVGCNKGNSTQKTSEKKEEVKNEDNKKYVAFISDVGSVDDGSFNQGSWEGVKEFADKNGYEKDFFKPLADTEEDRIDAMDKAVEAGADILVCVGSLFEKVIYQKQDEYKEKGVDILFLDGEPKDKNGEVKFASNVHSILFKEEEVGYLAGYFAVKEGYRKLGFFGGMDIKAVRAFGYGYVQGAEECAKELGLKEDAVEMNYLYAGVFSPSDKLTVKMKDWYDKGTEIIFSCGGGILYSVIEAAGNEDNRKIIGVDVDQAKESDHIVYSAMKELTKTIKSELESYENNGDAWTEEKAGKTMKVGVKENGVGLSATKDSWRIKNVTIDDYKELYDKMKEKELNIDGDELPELKYVKLTKEN